jgi:serine phosphatase RsbU (regulator of sigma subunit)
VFWRVGSRLALSYFVVGVLPFIFFAILLIVTGYVVAGVLSQTTLKMERSAALQRLAQWNLEYTLTGQRPIGALKTLEIYDTRDGTLEKIPEWLRTRTFTGLVDRDKHVLFVSSKLYELEDERRSVVMVQPLDAQWIKALNEKNGMLISASVASAKQNAAVKRRGKGVDIQYDNLEVDDDKAFDTFISKAFQRRGVIWGDISPPLYDWREGRQETSIRMVTALSNPWLNLLDFYFGNSQYVRASAITVGVIAGALAVGYLLATMMGAALHVSNTPAVNRIEKGTMAVERGDFSYRIRMRPTNQLGAVAQSFNRMTESIATLLAKAGERERLQSEIDIAATIQRNLLPRVGPTMHGVSFSAHFEPTEQIGGDYYDVFNLDQNRLAVAIGDVSGHGLSTGLVMAMVKAALTTLVEQGADEESLFHRLNDLVLRSTDKRAFMTLGYTVFDLRHRTIRHTNAGHLYPYIIRHPNNVVAVEAPSLPLGVRAEAVASTVEMELRGDDTIVYVSDGIIEAQDDLGEPFGFERLESLLSTLRDRSPAEVQSAVLAAVAKHGGTRTADDDRTVMVLRFENVALGDAFVANDLALESVE